MADTSLDEVSTLEISKLKVPDLKKELKNRGLTTTGNKNELVERLQAALKSSDTGTVDSIDDIEEDLLNDDDDDHMDERESLINDLDNALDDLPKTQKRKSDTEHKSEVPGGPPKKVILKRNTSEALAAMAIASKVDKKPIDEEKVEDNVKSADSTEEKKVVKLSELSAKERLEMRAKKFGVITFSDDAKKVARAERFGTNRSTNASSIQQENNASIDVLKQRAARFGVSVSSVMSDIEKKEKLEKRKERFGVLASKSTVKTGGSDLEALKAARLERFKATVK